MFHYPVGKAYGAPRPSPHRRANYPSPRATRLLTPVRKYQISGRHGLCWRNIVSPCCRNGDAPKSASHGFRRNMRRKRKYISRLT
jgi:hypothetical protein